MTRGDLFLDEATTERGKKEQKNHFFSYKGKKTKKNMRYYDTHVIDLLCIVTELTEITEE